MLKPLGDRVVLEVQKEEEQSVGGIVLASNAKEKPHNGQSNWPLVQDVSLITVKGSFLLSKGDQSVVFDKYAGTEVSYEGEKYLVVRENDIVAVVE